MSIGMIYCNNIIFKYLMKDAQITRLLLLLENNELLCLIANILRKAAMEEEVLRKIEIEGEVESTIEQHIREKQELIEKPII